MTAKSPHSRIDSGLLSPVRVGTPVEDVLSDEAWIDAMLQAEAGLAQAQSKLGLIPQTAADAISRGATAHTIDARAVAVASRQTANPVVFLIKQLKETVRNIDPNASQYVHRGSTSQDILDTAAMMVSHSALDQVALSLRAVSERLGKLTVEHKDSLQAARTLGGHAVPTTFGFKSAGWKQYIDDALERVTRLVEGGLPVSLGGAAGTLAGYVENAHQVEMWSSRSPAEIGLKLTTTYAAEVGLTARALPWHSAPTPMADIAAVCALVAGALGKIATDVVTLNRTEINELDEAWESGRGASSAMPHKRNPVLATMVRSASMQIPALAGGLYACLTPMDERDAGSWHAQWLLLRECLRLTAGAASTTNELVTGLRVNVATMAENARKSGALLTAEKLFIVLSSHIGPDEAKNAIDTAVSNALDNREDLVDVLSRDSRIEKIATRAELHELAQPGTYLGIASNYEARG